MIGLGYIGDQPWLNVSKTYSVCLICKCWVLPLRYASSASTGVRNIVTNGFSFSLNWQSAEYQLRWCQCLLTIIWCYNFWLPCLVSRLPAHFRSHQLFWSASLIWTNLLAPTVRQNDKITNTATRTNHSFSFPLQVWFCWCKELEI